MNDDQGRPRISIETAKRSAKEYLRTQHPDLVIQDCIHAIFVDQVNLEVPQPESLYYVTFSVAKHDDEHLSRRECQVAMKVGSMTSTVQIIQQM